MEEKVIELKLTQRQVDVIFECFIGSCSCPSVIMSFSSIFNILVV